TDLRQADSGTGQGAGQCERTTGRHVDVRRGAQCLGEVDRLGRAGLIVGDVTAQLNLIAEEVESAGPVEGDVPERRARAEIVRVVQPHRAGKYERIAGRGRAGRPVRAG